MDITSFGSFSEEMLGLINWYAELPSPVIFLDVTVVVEIDG